MAIENLIAAGFAPTRSVVLAFGFDEESGGTQVRLRCEHTFIWETTQPFDRVPRGSPSACFPPSARTHSH